MTLIVGFVFLHSSARVAHLRLCSSGFSKYALRDIDTFADIGCAIGLTVSQIRSSSNTQNSAIAISLSKLELCQAATKCSRWAHAMTSCACSYATLQLCVQKRLHDLKRPRLHQSVRTSNLAALATENHCKHNLNHTTLPADAPMARQEKRRVLTTYLH